MYVWIKNRQLRLPIYPLPNSKNKQDEITTNLEKETIQKKKKITTNESTIIEQKMLDFAPWR